jgi:hypothetical protein
MGLRFQTGFDDGRGYLVSIPALVWTAIVFLNLYQRTRVDIRKHRAIADKVQRQVQDDQAA